MIRIVVLALLLVPGAVYAQGTESTWPGLHWKTSGLPTVFVIDDAGAETMGKLVRFDPDAIVLMVDGTERRIEAARVRRIDKRDSLRNGIIIGAVFGLATGVLTSGLADCPGSSDECPAFRIAGPVVSTAFYAAVGAGIDALVAGRTAVYVAPVTSMQAARSTQGRQVALNLRLRW